MIPRMHAWHRVDMFMTAMVRNAIYVHNVCRVVSNVSVFVDKQLLAESDYRLRSNNGGHMLWLEVRPWVQPGWHSLTMGSLMTSTPWTVEKTFKTSSRPLLRERISKHAVPPVPPQSGLDACSVHSPQKNLIDTHNVDRTDRGLVYGHVHLETQRVSCCGRAGEPRRGHHASSES